MQHILVSVLGFKRVNVRLVQKKTALQKWAETEKARESWSKFKVMLIVYFDYCGVVPHELVLQCQTFNKKYYLSILKFLC